MTDRPRLEYRVRWRREGHRQVTRIYQSRESAVRKAQAILALERVKNDTAQWGTMPDLHEQPTIEVRPVGEWGELPGVPVPTPDEHTIERVRKWANPAVNDHYGIF